MNNASRSRVVVWLDPNTPQEDALPALAGLGAAAEVLGLFVEDSDLLDLSRLSVAREITYEGKPARKMEQSRTEQQFRAHGARMRNVFEAAARKLSARHSFRVTRGVLRTELQKVSADCDTLVLTHSRREFGPRLTIRMQLGDLLACGPRTLVIVQERWQTGRRIAVLFDGSPTSEHALRAGAAIAQSENAPLTVWLPESGDAGLEEKLPGILGGSTGRFVRRVALQDIDALVRATDEENVRVLVLPTTEPAGTRQIVTELLDRANCSIIIVR
ncbi:MAG: universal stress protein [Gammaproteobacteria bacterium]|nr:universal stress protein [Gammaproteobacteria bacterium]NND37913.1 universal stress protein [Gammaproteobacteria bacterium]